jgi:hypothetical protein|tara:strand:- start:1187 stop:1531 length:345 start_codon:yes stop_codon:yes gene_type:complete
MHGALGKSVNEVVKYMGKGLSGMAARKIMTRSSNWGSRLKSAIKYRLVRLLGPLEQRDGIDLVSDKGFLLPAATGEACGCFGMPQGSDTYRVRLGQVLGDFDGRPKMRRQYITY